MKKYVYLVVDDEMLNLVAICRTEERAREEAADFLTRAYDAEELEEFKDQAGWGEKTMTHYLTWVAASDTRLEQYNIHIEAYEVKG